MDFDLSSWISFDGFYEEQRVSLSGSEPDFKDRPNSPTINLRADEETLRCLQWILVNQNEQTYEIESMSGVEDEDSGVAFKDEETCFGDTTPSPSPLPNPKSPVEKPDIRCPYCQEIFLNKRSLRSHIGKLHEKMLCDLCGITLGKKALKRHISEVHAPTLDFKCTKCPKVFNYASYLEKHLLFHEKEPNGYLCDKCPHVSISLGSLNAHKYRKHTRKLKYECHLCGKQYSVSKGIAQHFKDSHKLSVPVGFRRFTYGQDEDMVYRLKTTVPSIKSAPLKVSENIPKNKRI